MRNLTCSPGSAVQENPGKISEPLQKAAGSDISHWWVRQPAPLPPWHARLYHTPPRTACTPMSHPSPHRMHACITPLHAPHARLHHTPPRTACTPVSHPSTHRMHACVTPPPSLLSLGLTPRRRTSGRTFARSPTLNATIHPGYVM